MKNSNNTGKIIGAALAGVAIGGVLGILFAPDKGSETRRKLLEKGADLKDLIQDKIARAIDQINPDQQLKIENKN
ncbi:MAG: YtxH domain-containing protein [Crocinitomicaceae bacterium]